MESKNKHMRGRRRGKSFTLLLLEGAGKPIVSFRGESPAHIMKLMQEKLYGLDARKGGKRKNGKK